MKFKVNKITAAVAAGLGVSMVGVNVAQADQLLFPYAAMSPTVTTVLSVVNKSEAGFFFVESDELHYHYYHKSGSAATDRLATCQEINFGQTTSANDIVTFDVSGVYGDDIGVMFEDNATNENAVYSNATTKDFAGLRGFGISRAFVLVDNDASFDIFGAELGNQLHGEAMVMEFQSGATWGYQAYNAASIVGTNGAFEQLNPFEFSDRVETKGEVLAANADPTDAVRGASLRDNWVPVSIMPFDEISTRFFVTPIATTYNNGLTSNPLYANNGPFQFRGDLTAVVGLAVASPLDPANTNTIVGVMFDRDENPVSGRNARRVTCVAGLDVLDLLADGVADRLPNGGWSNFTVSSITSGQRANDTARSLTDQVVAIKLEFNDKAAPTLDGDPVGGIYNNGYWLTRGLRESQSRIPVFVNGAATQSLLTFQISGDGLILERNSPYPLLPTLQLPADNVPVTSVFPGSPQ